MCDLLRTYNQPSFTGYKLAAKRDGKYYSLAMGTRYYKDGRIRIPKEQTLLCDHFNSSILEGSKYEGHLMRGTFGYRSKMVGRTACFMNKSDIKKLMTQIKCFRDYELVLLEVKVSDDLMFGEYHDADVVAGRHMKILRELS